MRALAAAIAILAAGCAESAPAEPVERLHLTFDGPPVFGAPRMEVVQPATGTKLVTGVVGKALEFDGTGAKLEVEELGAAGFKDRVTVELWLRASAEHNPVRKASTYTCAAHTSTFLIAYDGHRRTVAGRITTTTDKVRLRAPKGKVKVGAWHHVALVYDGEQALLYLDGEVAAAKPCTGPLQMRPALPFWLGTWYRDNQAFYGAIDEVRVLDGALSAAVIASRARQAPAPR